MVALWAEHLVLTMAAWKVQHLVESSAVWMAIPKAGSKAPLMVDSKVAVWVVVMAVN